MGDDQVVELREINAHALERLERTACAINQNVVLVALQQHVRVVVTLIRHGRGGAQDN